MTVEESLKERIRAWTVVPNALGQLQVSYLTAVLDSATREQLDSEWVGPQ